jgi:hypothetical protein
MAVHATGGLGGRLTWWLPTHAVEAGLHGSTSRPPRAGDFLPVGRQHLSALTSRRTDFYVGWYYCNLGCFRMLKLLLIVLLLVT